MAPTKHLTNNRKETTMDFKENFYASLAEFLAERGIENATVTRFEQETESDGFCETCYYEYTVVNIFYEVDGKSDEFNYRGSFSELINDLTS